MTAVVRARAIRELEARPPGGGPPRRVAAASGLARAGETLYLVADDEHELCVFEDPAAPGALVPFLHEPLPDDPAERKRRKPDLEALVRLPHVPALGGGALLALGSGSTGARGRGFLWRLRPDGRLRDEAAAAIDLAPLYAALAAELPDLNVEGAAVAGGRLLLFQRGNGAAGVNAVAALDLDAALGELAAGALSPRPLAAVRRHELGSVAGVGSASRTPRASPTGASSSRPSPRRASRPTSTASASAPPSGC